MIEMVQLPRTLLGLLPPPLRGRVGGGAGCRSGVVRQHRPPPPTPPQPAAGLPASGKFESDQTPAGRGLVGEGSNLRRRLSVACTAVIVASSVGAALAQ